MTERSVEHASFTIDRRYPASPARVFAAWADPAAKVRWFGNPEGWATGPYELEADGDGTRLSLTEHGAYLDGLDSPAQRQQGGGSLLDALGEELRA